MLNAQGGSNYSAFGIGELHHGIGAAYDALAGTSIAVPFDGAISNGNPAQWSFLKTTRLQTGYRFNQQRVENDKNILWQNNGKIDGMLINFCLDTALAANINLGFSAYSSVNYLIALPITIDECGIKKTGKTIYQGQGGISQAWLGAAVKPLKWASIGASVFTLFGNIEKSAATILYGRNSVPSRTYMRDVYSSLGFRFGLLLEPTHNLFLGAYTEINPTLTADRELVFQSAYAKDSTITSTNIFDYPSLFGFGFSYSFNKFMIAADYIQRDYTNFTYNNGNARFRKYSNISFGFARLGQFGYKKTFLDRATLMLGAGYKQKYLSVQGTPIDEYYGSFGISAPLIGFARLDAAITLGVRGTIDKGLIRENFGRLTISLSIGDIWFQPYKRY